MLTWLCALAATFGCDSSGKDKLYPVKGKVTLDGSPLTGGAIAFHPDTDKGNKAKGTPAGSIGSDGTYSLSTDGKSGAPPGAYKVTVATDFPGASGTPVPINARFNNPDGSGLTCEVSANASPGAYDFKVTK